MEQQTSEACTDGVKAIAASLLISALVSPSRQAQEPGAAALGRNMNADWPAMPMKPFQMTAGSP